MSCYSDYSNYVVYACECDANVVDNYKLLCPGNDTCGTRVDGNGNEEYVCDVLECKLEGGPVEGYTRYCFPDNAPDACTACGCKSENTTNVSWTFIGSGRVTRTITSVSSSGYTCSQSKTAEFGCAAGYYRSAGSGSTMTCTACPSGGTSVAGNSSGIGACYKPAGSSFTDTKGTYTCSGAAYYK